MSASCLAAISPGFMCPADGQGRLIYKVIAGFCRGFSFFLNRGIYGIFLLFRNSYPAFLLREKSLGKRELHSALKAFPLAARADSHARREGRGGGQRPPPRGGTSVIREHVSMVKPCDKCSAPCFQPFTTLSIGALFPRKIGKFRLP